MDKKDLKILNIDTTLYHTRISRKFENRKPYCPADPKLIISFIPGTVTDILVVEGDELAAGTDLLVLEAMKMQNRIKSPVSGRVKRIHVELGTRVPKGTLLIELD